MIGSKKNSQASINCMISRISLKTLEQCTPEKLNTIHTPAGNIEKENKINLVRQNEELKTLLQIDNQHVNKLYIDNDINDQSEVIFNVSSYKRYNNDGGKLIKGKKLKRYNHTRKIRLNFRNTRNTWNRTVKHCKEGAEESVPNVLPRSKVLKKVFAKEKLPDHISLSREYIMNLLNANSLSRLSVMRKVFPSRSVKNLFLPHKSSSLFIYDELCNINSTNSEIKILPDKCIPYNTDIFNVAVAVVHTKSTESNKLTITPSEDKYILFREDLTSSETITLPSLTITSKTQFTEFFSVEDNLKCCVNTTSNLSDASNKTLVNVDIDHNSHICVTSDHDNFFNARTSSDFNRSILSSNYTVTSNSTSDCHSENVDLTDNVDVNRNLICNTVINIDVLADTTPSTSSAVKHGSDLNDVIIKQPLKTYFSDKNKGDNEHTNNLKDLSTNILIKPIDVEKNTNHHKTLNLPNETTLKWQIENQGDPLNFYSEEFKNNYPINFSDMWDKFILVLDKSIKKIEETLAEKVTNELKKLIDILNHYKHGNISVPMKIEEESLHTKENRTTSDKEVSANRLTFEINEEIQCDLLKKTIIDELMINIETPKSEKPVYKKSREWLKEKIFKDYLDILTTPIADSQEDSIPVPAASFELNVDGQRFYGLKNAFRIPVQFFKENAFVITSVPIFFAILLCIYGLILLVI